MAAPVKDHNVDISIFSMVKNRVPYVNDNDHETKASHYTYELMYELEPCLAIASTDLEGNSITKDLSRIGHEQNYTVPQQSLIADLVSIYLLRDIIINNSVIDQSSAEGVTSKFIKKAKAGDTEVEYEAVDLKKQNYFAQSPKDLLTHFQKSAISRAAKLGCVISFCDSCSLTINKLITDSVMLPFFVADKDTKICPE